MYCAEKSLYLLEIHIFSFVLVKQFLVTILLAARCGPASRIAGSTPIIGSALAAFSTSAEPREYPCYNGYNYRRHKHQEEEDYYY